MNYLELCQAVVREGAIVGGDSKPDSVEFQTGRMRLVVDRVNRANREIQSSRNDFSFRSRSIDFNVASNTEILRLTASHPDVESINTNTVSLRTPAERKLIGPTDWIVYRSMRVTGVDVSKSLPDSYSVDPAGDIHFIPESTQDFILRAECKLRPQTLVNNTDQPWIPDGYHDVILYRALMFFYKYDESEQYAEARDYYHEWLSKLIAATTPMGDWNYTQTGENLMVISSD